MNIEIFNTIEECRVLRNDWNEIALINAHDPLGIGVNCSYEMTETLWRTHLHGLPQYIIVAYDNDRVMGIMPCYMKVTKRLGFVRKEIGLIYELYLGRSGFIVREQSLTILESLLDAVFNRIKGWDIFHITTVNGGPSNKLIKNVIDNGYCCADIYSHTVVPYIKLPSSWDEYLSSRKRAFRKGIKKYSKKLISEGEVEIKAINNEDDVDYFLNAMFSIERKSWKEASGTSLTKKPLQEEFHRVFTSVAAHAGLLKAYLLTLNGLPIAYHYNVLYGEIIYDFKSSYIDDFKKLAPGKVLRSMILEQFINEGIQIMDFVGEIQPHKMDWTDATYKISNYTLFNNTLHSKIWWLRSRFSRYFKRFTPN